MAENSAGGVLILPDRLSASWRGRSDIWTSRNRLLEGLIARRAFLRCREASDVYRYFIADAGKAMRWTWV